MEITKASEEHQELSIFTLGIALWQKKLFIAIITGCSTIVAVVFAFLCPLTYTSITKFISVSPSASKSQYTDLAALAGISLGNQNTIDPSGYLDQVIQNEWFVTKLLNHKWYYKGDSLLFEKILQIEPDTTVKNWQFIFQKNKIDNLRKGDYISFDKDDKTGIMTLTTNFNDPNFVYDVNTYVFQLLNDYILNVRVSNAKDNCDFIQKRISEAKEQLTKDEDQLTTFRERNIGGTSPQVSLQESRLNRAVAINQEIYLQLEKQYVMAQIDQKNDQPSLEIIKNPEIPVKPTKPVKKLIVVIGFVLGVFTGVMLISFKKWFDVNLNHINDI